MPCLKADVRIAKLNWLGLLSLSLALIRPAITATLEKEKSEAVQTIREFIQATQARDVAAIARHIRFPLGRPYPLPAISTPEEFARRFDELFDADLIKTIADSSVEKNWSAMGWRGYMLNDGIVWADADGITAIHHESKKEREFRFKLIEADRQTLPANLRSFAESVLKWETKSYKLRIDNLGNQNYRLVLWNADQRPRDEPVVATQGERIFDGSGGNHYYLFRQAGIIYRCDVTVLGSDESGIGSFSILQGDRTLKEENVLREY